MDGCNFGEIIDKWNRKSGLRSGSTLRRVRHNSFLCILGICLLTLNGLANAGTYTLVSPQSFLRPSGESIADSFNFAARDSSGTYTLTVYNGGLEDDLLTGEAVSSSIISLNGIQIFGPSEFNQNVTTLSKPVALQSTNELSVQLWGKPGGVITLEIIGEDSVVPTITASVSPVSNSAGWHKSDVEVNFQCDDVTSGIATCPEPTTVTVEGAAQVFSGTAVDNAGNQASTSVTINLDKTLPTIVAQPDSAANAAGWHNSAVQVNFDCQDMLSGVASCASPITTSTEGNGQIVTGNSTDVADNTASVSLTLNVDLTAPTIQITSPLAGSVLSEQRPTILFTVADNFLLNLNSLTLSVNGVAFDGICSVENGSATCIPNSDLPSGNIILAASVVDQAYNTGTDQISFQIESDLDGDGIDDNIDQCPNTPFGETVDALGCAASELDSDNDGVTNDLDLCPNTQTGITVDITGCPVVAGDDTDSDSIADANDNCPTIFNPDQADTDADGTGDACEFVGSITITSPTAAQVINTSTTSVIGTFTGPAGSGVIVNGRQACTYNNQFSINNIPVNTGDHSITAQLAPAVGIGESTQITINRDGDSLYRIEPNTNCTVAPFDAKFSLDNIDTSINQIDVDYDNDGLYDASITDLTNPVFEYTYTNPGSYQVNIVGLDNLGNLHNQNLSIIVHNGAAIDAVIQAGWQNITVGLSTNDIAQALNELTPNAQEKYAPVFDSLQGNLPAILSTFSDLQPVDINISYAEYAINRTIDGVDRVFLIYFVKNGNGEWKLESM